MLAQCAMRIVIGILLLFIETFFTIRIISILNFECSFLATCYFELAAILFTSIPFTRMFTEREESDEFLTTWQKWIPSYNLNSSTSTFSPAAHLHKPNIYWSWADLSFSFVANRIPRAELTSISHLLPSYHRGHRRVITGSWFWAR